MAPLLDIDLSVRYPSSGARIDNVCLSLQPGEILGLAGESGSGKSTVALGIIGLVGLRGGIATGRVEFSGRDLLGCTQSELRRLRGFELSLLLQNSMSALNPSLRLRTQFLEAWRAHSQVLNGCQDAALRTLNAVGLSGDGAFLERYPRELSTGMAQRVLLALALLHGPRLLIADEPTSALDVITQGEVLALFRTLNRTYGLSLLLISHDVLALVSICDRIAVMKDGMIVETASAADLLVKPIHPYTQQLVRALPLEILGRLSHTGDKALPSLP